jgi:subtilisin family serine protease
MSVDATPSQIRALASLPFVRRIDPVLSFARKEPPSERLPSIPPLPDDPLFWQYGRSFIQLSQINVVPLHRLGYSGKDVLVCMMDTGFWKAHEAFSHAPIIAEWDFVNNDGDVNPDSYREEHGTATWSLLAGYKTGELIGPAYGASFLLAKTESTEFERPIEEDYWAAGIEWAESLGAEVVSSSLGYIDWYSFADMDGETAVTTRCANRASELGVVVVNAAGNERGTSWGHIIAPADGFNVIACGAVDSLGRLTDFSSPGPTYDGRIKPEVCALGESAWYAARGEDSSFDYVIGDGTSFSTPLVAGVCALLLEVHRDWTPVQVRTALLSTASQSRSPNNDYGWGIVDAALAADLGLPSVSLEGYSVDEDSSGESLGNGDGRVEPGETLEISVTVENNGRFPVSGLHGSLSAAHPEVVISVAEADFPLLAPSESGQIERPFVAKIPAGFLGHHVVFWLKVAGPQDLLLLDFLRISVSR